MDHEHSITINAGDSNVICETCGDSVSVSFGDRVGLCDPFQSAVEDHLDLSAHLPKDFSDNYYLPEALFEILRLNRRGWEPKSPFLARLMDRLPLRWVHYLASCGLSLVLANRHEKLFAVDSQCRLTARPTEEEEEPPDVMLDTHQLEDEVLEEMGRNLTEFYARDTSVHELERKILDTPIFPCSDNYNAQQQSLKQMDAETNLMETKMMAMKAGILNETAKLDLLRENNRQHLDRQIALETRLQATTEEMVQLQFEQKWQSLKQLETEASAVLGKLNRMKDSHKSSTPLLDSNFAQWEEFLEQLTEYGGQLLKQKEKEASELKQPQRIVEFRSQLARLQSPAKPTLPNFAQIMDEAKRRDRQASSVKSLSRSTSGGLSDSVLSLNRSSHLPSPTLTATPLDELLKRLNEMIPDLRREDMEKMLSDLSVKPSTVNAADMDHLLQILTERWFQNN